MFTLLLVSCNEKSPKEYPVLPYPEVVVWDNKAYVVSEETVSKDMVTEEFGEVKRYIDPYEKLPEKDGDSTIAPAGSKLYLLKDSNLKDGFAVKINGKFYKAYYNEP